MAGLKHDRVLTRREFLRGAVAGAAAAAAWSAPGAVLASASTARSGAMAEQKQGAMASVPRYGRWQAGFDVRTQAERVEFTGPDGGVEVRPTFAHLPARLTYWTAPLGLDRTGRDVALSDEAGKREPHHGSKTEIQRGLQAAGGGGGAGRRGHHGAGVPAL